MRRVVITGLGMVTPLGCGVEHTWARLIGGQSGAKIIINRDPRQILQKVAPFLKVDSDPYPFVDSASGDIVWNGVCSPRNALRSP